MSRYKMRGINYTVRSGMRISDLAKRWDVTPTQMREILESLHPEVIKRNAQTDYYYLIEGTQFNTCRIDLIIHNLKNGYEKDHMGVQEGSGLLWEMRKAKQHEIDYLKISPQPISHYCSTFAPVFTDREAALDMTATDIEIPVFQWGRLVYVPAFVTSSWSDDHAGEIQEFIEFQIEPKALARIPHPGGRNTYIPILEGAGIYTIQVSPSGKFLEDGAIELAKLPVIKKPWYAKPYEDPSKYKLYYPSDYSEQGLGTE